jgi:pilus assembly protein CpaC
MADEIVKTVAIAEPKIADAAVGSERTVVVSGKQIGSTSLVVYGDGGRFRVYEIEVYSPTADKQVALHVRIAEINDRAKKELGFDITGAGRPNTPGHNDYITGGLFTTKVSSPSIPNQFVGPLTDGGLSYSRDAGNFLLESSWRALEEKGDIKVLANPTLVAKSGQKASFLVGGELPIPIASGGTGNVITVTIEWKSFGIRLDFTPTVESDGSLTLEVEPEVSRLDYTNPLTLSGFSVPLIDTRRASTTVHMNSGEHLVLGGLKQTERTKVARKVPVLGDIPLLNLFFSYSRTESVDRDLLIVVSPEMIESSTSMPKLPTDGRLQTK